jgi:hypothetical protein
MRFYFKMWFISMTLFFWETPRLLWAFLSSCVACQPSYFAQTIYFFLSFLYFFVGFDRRIMHVCGYIIGLGSWCPIYFSKELGFGGYIFVR